jgi:hypothetical protein
MSVGFDRDREAVAFGDLGDLGWVEASRGLAKGLRAPGTISQLPASPRFRPFPAAPSAVRPIQTEGRRTGT